MALQTEQTVDQRVVALFLEQRNGQKFALGLGHFAGFRVEVVHMEPVVAPLMAEIGLGLCNLVRVVREGIVDAAAVDVEVFAEVLHADAGALDVPAGVADAPRGVPLERLILKFRFCEPEDEVVFVALVDVLLHALTDADLEVLLLVVVEHVVFFQLGRVKIHVAAGKIGIALGKQSLNDVDILGNAVGGRLDDVRALDVELIAVGEERVGVVFCDLHDGFMLALGALEHFVLAGVCVGGEVADVGDIHDAADVVAEVAQALFQHVLHDIAAQVADVGVMVDRRAAGVHFDDIGMVGDKELFFVR